MVTAPVVVQPKVALVDVVDAAGVRVSVTVGANAVGAGGGGGGGGGVPGGGGGESGAAGATSVGAGGAPSRSDGGSAIANRYVAVERRPPAAKARTVKRYRPGESAGHVRGDAHGRNRRGGLIDATGQRRSAALRSSAGRALARRRAVSRTSRHVARRVLCGTVHANVAAPAMLVRGGAEVIRTPGAACAVAALTARIAASEVVRPRRARTRLATARL